MNKFSGFNLAALWFGAAISVAEIITGGLLAPLGFKLGLTVIIIGHVIGGIVMIAAGNIGFEKKLASMETTELTFGKYGKTLFSFLNGIQLIGWTVIMLITGGSATSVLTENLFSFGSVSTWIIILGIFISLWLYVGKGLWKIGNMIIGLSMFAVTIILINIGLGIPNITATPNLNIISIGLAIELTIVMPISWVPLVADYTRDSKSKLGGNAGTFIGYFVGSSLMYFVGLIAALGFQSTDIGTILLEQGYGLIGVAIIMLSTISTTYLDAFSAGVSIKNLLPNFSEKHLGTAVVIVSTLIALTFPMTAYQNFLLWIGALFVPLFAILITDYYILKNQMKSDKLALLTWLIGIVIYRIFVNIDLSIGTTLPVMGIVSIIYYTFSKGVITWKAKKAQSSTT
jgi:putative hydroxymethylpyrimidine transporter CytX